MFGKGGKLEHITPGMALATTRIIERIRDGKPGDIVEDDELSRTAERPVGVGQPGYPYLMSAIRYCRQNYSVNWERVPRAGYIRCLKPDETLESVARNRKAIGRKGRKAIQMLKNVNGQADERTKPQISLQLAQFGALVAFASSDMTKRLATIQNPTHNPDLKRLLEAMK